MDDKTLPIPRERPEARVEREREEQTPWLLNTADDEMEITGQMLGDSELYDYGIAEARKDAGVGRLNEQVAYLPASSKSPIAKYEGVTGVYHPRDDRIELTHTSAGRPYDKQAETFVHEIGHKAIRRLRNSAAIGERKANADPFKNTLLQNLLVRNVGSNTEHVVWEPLIAKLKDQRGLPQKTIAHALLGSYLNNPTPEGRQQSARAVRGLVEGTKNSSTDDEAKIAKEQFISAIGTWMRGLPKDQETQLATKQQRASSRLEAVEMLYETFVDDLLDATTQLEAFAREKNKTPKQFADGGMAIDDQVDPISGNQVPTGAKPEEVRDDIPAKLSEGEFVVPADVVRYFGVQFFMKLRDEAKQGFARMEEMGQMGNSTSATDPDQLFSGQAPAPQAEMGAQEELPFSLEDIDMEAAEELHAANGTFVSSNNPVLRDIWNLPSGADVNANEDTADFTNTGNETSGRFRDNPAFSRDDLGLSLGEENFNYLAGGVLGDNAFSFRPPADGADGADDAADAAIDASGVNTFADWLDDSSDGDSNSGTGGMSVSEMSSIPSQVNVDSLVSFSEVPSSVIGLMDTMIANAINPAPRGMAAVQRGMEQLGLVSFDSIRGLASKDQVAARAHSLAMQSYVDSLPASTVATMNAYTNAIRSGVDVDGLAAQGVGLVSFTDPTTGQQTVGQSYGVVGANHTAVGRPDPYGSGVSIVNNKDQNVQPFGRNSLNTIDATIAGYSAIAAAAQAEANKANASLATAAAYSEMDAQEQAAHNESLAQSDPYGDVFGGYTGPGTATNNSMAAPTAEDVASRGTTTTAEDIATDVAPAGPASSGSSVDNTGGFGGPEGPSSMGGYGEDEAFGADFGGSFGDSAGDSGGADEGQAAGGSEEGDTGAAGDWNTGGFVKRKHPSKTKTKKRVREKRRGLAAR
jgi:hypothetical protein